MAKYVSLFSWAYSHQQLEYVKIVDPPPNSCLFQVFLLHINMHLLLTVSLQQI